MACKSSRDWDFKS